MMRLLLLALAASALTSCVGRAVNTDIRERHVVSRVDLRDMITTTGEVRPIVTVEIKSEAGDRIEKLYVKEGQAVKRGDTLLTIDPSRLLYKKSRADLAVGTARIQKERARRNLDNARRLAATGSVAAATLADLENEAELAAIAYRQHMLELEDINAELSKTSVLSPMDGVITALGVREGEIAVSAATGLQGGTSLAVIADIARLEVVCRIGEVDYHHLKVGQRVVLRPEARDAPPVNATISFIALNAKKLPGEELGSFEVRLSVDSGATGIAPGINVAAEFPVLERGNVVAVPYRFVKKTREGHCVDLVERIGNGAEKIRTVAVEVGATDYAYYEIISGLEPGDTVVSPADADAS